ncbi:MAG: YeeE/YedE thiosulfate transporter family protein [Desulfobacteraceae bacterium]|nr:YeeE/YedE thiosulfate transporter family protein [Desulfobacteraceae bacterium]
MSEGSVFASKLKGFYNKICREEWNAITAGIIVGFLSVMIFAWMRPWGAVGAMRNWGEWILYGVGWSHEAPKSALLDSGSVIGIGFVAGAFLSACLGNNFALRIPPFLEMVKGLVAGVLMGVGSAFAGGCNVGGMFNAIGNLAANGFAMWLGLVLGVLLGLKYLYWEMENVTWGSGGAKTIDFPEGLKVVFGIIALAGLIWGAYAYTHVEAYKGMLSGILLIAAGLGYTMQRGRWCMVQAFREPHMTGDCKLAKGAATAIMVVAIGGAVIKYTGLRAAEYYVRGTFGFGGVFGGFLFGIGAMLAGGCGSGSLWRVGEGQIKLWLAVVTFGVSNAIMSKLIEGWGWEGTQDASGVLGSWVYLPDTFLGYGGSLALIALAMGLWYVIVDWNEDTNKLTIEM